MPCTPGRYPRLREHCEPLRLAVAVEHRRAAGRRPHEIEQDSDRGGLAGAVQPEESEDIAHRNVERYVSQCGEPSVPLAEALEPHRRGAHDAAPVRGNGEL